jgi:hypothetical protein
MLMRLKKRRNDLRAELFKTEGKCWRIPGRSAVAVAWPPDRFRWSLFTCPPVGAASACSADRWPLAAASLEHFPPAPPQSLRQGCLTSGGQKSSRLEMVRVLACSCSLWRRGRVGWFWAVWAKCVHDYMYKTKFRSDSWVFKWIQVNIHAAASGPRPTHLLSLSEGNLLRIFVANN